MTNDQELGTVAEAPGEIHFTSFQGEFEMFKKKLLSSVVLVSVLLLSNTASAIPGDFDFSGIFTNDDDIVLIDFTVGSDSTITIFSSSWISGDSGLGFDPILAIWDSAGTLVAEQDDGGVVGSTLSNGVSYDHGTWDSYFDVFLSAGHYTASIAQFNNFAAGSNLTDGFIRDGNPNFTFDQVFGTEPKLNGVWSLTDTRTGDWEFHILNVDSATQVSVPEPASLALLGIGLAGLGFTRRQRRA